MKAERILIAILLFVYLILQAINSLVSLFGIEIRKSIIERIEKLIDSKLKDESASTESLNL